MLHRVVPVPCAAAWYSKQGFAHVLCHVLQSLSMLPEYSGRAVPCGHCRWAVGPASVCRNLGFGSQLLSVVCGSLLQSVVKQSVAACRAY